MSFVSLTSEVDDGYDILIKPENLDDFIAAVRFLGFTVLADPMRFSANTPEERWIHRISKIIAGETLSLDLVIASPIFANVWETRKQLQWQNQILWVVSRDGLERMKRLSGRLQDLADIERMHGEE